MKQFTTAVTEVQETLGDEEWPLEFELDGRVMHFRRPDPGEGVLLITAMATHNDVMSKFSATLDIVFRVLRPDDKEWWHRRILDRHDPMHLQAPNIMAGDDRGEGGVVQEIVAQWGARPTESPSPSSASPPPAGPGSSPFIRTPTSSASPYPGS